MRGFTSAMVNALSTMNIPSVMAWKTDLTNWAVSF